MPFRKCVETFTFGICPLWCHTNSSLCWFSINSTPSPGIGSSQWDRLVVSFQMFEVQQKQARTEDANSVLNVPFSLQDCWGYTFLFLRSAGDPKVQTVVARSQPARRWRQRSTESPGDNEEQRTRGRFAGMFFDTAALPAGSPRPFNLSALLHSQPAVESDRLRLWTWPPRRRRSKPGWSTKASPECETHKVTSVVVLVFVWNNVTYSSVFCCFFARSTVNTLGVLTGKLLLGMTKDEIRTVCPEEGGKVFFQLQAVKSSIAVKHQVTWWTQTRTDCILRR